MSQHTVIAICLPLLFLLSFAAGRSSVKPLVRRGRARRRAGYIPLSPTAYGNANQATAPRPATSTACKPDGLQRAVQAGQERQPAPSRTTAPIVSGYVTATHPGGPTTVAAGPDRFVWPDGITRFYEDVPAPSCTLCGSQMHPASRCPW